MPNAKTKKIKSALSALLVLTIVGGAFFVSAIISQNKTIQISGQSLAVEVADEPAERERGLCCRDSLVSDSGMLFVYDKPGYYSFWMKDTRIPLDIIWVDSAEEIVYIEEYVQPESYPNESFVSESPAQYIIETNAGWVRANGVAIGDSVQLN